MSKYITEYNLFIFNFFIIFFSTGIEFYFTEKIHNTSEVETNKTIKMLLWSINIWFFVFTFINCCSYYYFFNLLYLYLVSFSVLISFMIDLNIFRQCFCQKE